MVKLKIQRRARRPFMRPKPIIKSCGLFLQKNMMPAVLLVSGIVLIAGWIIFSSMAPVVPQDVSQYNKGLLAHQQQSQDEAAYWFERVAAVSDEDDLREAAVYNIGTMLGERAFDEKRSPEERFSWAQKAIDKLREAIKIDPYDESAKWNLELLLIEQKGIAQEMLTGGTEPDQEPGPDEQPGYSPGDGNRGF